MKDDLFRQYVERTRNCDEALLDIAVRKGIQRAKNDVFDFRKLMRVAVMCVLATALCVIISSDPVMKEAADFVYANSAVTQSGSEVLWGYLNNTIDTISQYLGEELK